MSRQYPIRLAPQRGIVLIASLLLLLVMTILALAMFRSMGLAEKIAGNVREKQRALHAAEVAEQFAEYWLSSPTNPSLVPVACSATGDANQGVAIPLICSNAIDATAATLPWTAGGASVGFTYHPNSGSAVMTVDGTADANGSYANSYVAPPAFYIQYLGLAPDGGGTVYKIDAVGYGGSPLSVAVVESMYEIGSGVINRGGL